MNKSTPLAALAAVAIVAASVIVASPASAVQASYSNPAATADQSDIDITSVDINYGADSITMTAHVQNLPAIFEFRAWYTRDNVPTYSLQGDFVFAYARSESGNVTRAGTQTQLNGGSATDNSSAPVSYSRDDAAGTLTLTMPSSLVPWGGDVYASAELAVGGDSYLAGASVSRNQNATGWGPIQKGQIGTATSIALSAKSQKHGASGTTFFAVVSPASAPGQVVFFDGATPIGTVTAAGGGAAIGVPVLASGTHKIHATFFSSDPNYGSSQSASVSYKVISTAHSTKTKVHASSSIQHYKKTSVRVAVKLSSTHAAGKVVLYQGKKKLTSATLKKGKAHLTVRKSLSTGRHVLTVKYFPANSEAYKTSRSRAFSVTVIR